MTITDKALVKRDVGRAEHSTTLTTAIGVTLDSRKTIDETGSVKLTNDDVSLTKDVTRRAFTDGSSMITYATFPTAAIDVTGRTTLNIGIGRSNEIIVEIILGYFVFVVHRTYSTCCIEVLGYLTTKQGDIGGAVYITGIRSICITQTATVGVSAAQASVIHITADIGTCFDENVGVIFLAISFHR